MGTLAIVRLNEDIDPPTLREFVAGVEQEVQQTYAEAGVSPSIVDTLRAYISGKAIVVEGSHPAAEAIEHGTKPRVMWELLNKVIPIKTESGVTIFRKASMKSFLRGGWTRSHVPGKHLVPQAVRRYQGHADAHFFASVISSGVVASMII